MKIIRKITHDEFKDFLLRNIDARDSNIYEEANNRNMIGTFQMTAGTCRHILGTIKPSNFDELNAVNAFARPGTMDFVPQYIENRETNKSPYPKEVADILKETNSICIYQEQTMEIFNKIGGFSLEETNSVRGLMKVLGKLEKKKEDLDKWDEVIVRFQEEARKKNISNKDATMIANDLLKMSSYMFNKSHSTAYTYIATITLYLSYYFRKFFYSSVLHYEVGRDKYLLDRLKAVKNQGFKIFPPNINLSSRFISPVKDLDNTLIFGIEDVKFVGEGPTKEIIENGPYKDFIDFYLKILGKRVTIRAVRALISIGAFDDLHKDRKRLLTKVNKFWEEKKSIKVEEKLRFLWNKIDEQIESIPGLNADYADLRQFEKEYLGFNFFISPFTDNFMEKVYLLQKKGLAQPDFGSVTKYSSKVPVVVNSMRVFNDRNGKEMAFVEVEDMTGEVVSLPIFQSLWEYVKGEIIEGKVHMMNVYEKRKDNSDETQIMFGSAGWPKPAEIQRFVKRLDNL